MTSPLLIVLPWSSCRLHAPYGRAWEGMRWQMLGVSGRDLDGRHRQCIVPTLSPMMSSLCTRLTPTLSRSAPDVTSGLALLPDTADCFLLQIMNSCSQGPLTPPGFPSSLLHPQPILPCTACAGLHVLHARQHRIAGIQLVCMAHVTPLSETVAPMGPSTPPFVWDAW